METKERMKTEMEETVGLYDYKIGTEEWWLVVTDARRETNTSKDGELNNNFKEHKSD